MGEVVFCGLEALRRLRDLRLSPLPLLFNDFGPVGNDGAASNLDFGPVGNTNGNFGPLEDGLSDNGTDSATGDESLTNERGAFGNACGSCFDD
ncbi:hypothetical protein WICPIJ_003446 [Wickerhamomyces pijperi]|uniref:Uncharacterized protein n=1 Tax=Wickerhamomyces pijperi TaxID=599730 RepID=A0A9P8Q9X6_WICPI|nr:hypothetical protein WICPIJ_003446 [Wickerhamomyces pijperi]